MDTDGVASVAYMVYLLLQKAEKRRLEFILLRLWDGVRISLVSK